MTDNNRSWCVALLLSMAAALVTIQIIKLMNRLNAKNPVTGPITSKFGKRKAPVAGASTYHNGVDVGVPVGTQVVAPWDGTVLSTYSNAAGGNQMIVKHPNGYRTGYAHLSEFCAQKGDRVAAGQTICLSGNTGRGTGAHLHFTLTNPAGQKVDPETVFDFKA